MYLFLLKRHYFHESQRDGLRRGKGKVILSSSFGQRSDFWKKLWYQVSYEDGSARAKHNTENGVITNLIVARHFSILHAILEGKSNEQ